MKSINPKFISYFLVFYLCCSHSFPALSFSQSNLTSAIVTGKVIDNDTGGPLYLANVYLSGTTLGASTDLNGYFTIFNVPKGRYELITSYVGYGVNKKNINIKKHDQYLYEVKLKYSENSLKEVVVEGDNTEWKKNIKIFTREFLGTSEFAKNTKILNPEVIKLKFDESIETLYTETYSSIKVENNSLGYDIIINLETFSHNPTYGTKIKYKSYFNEKPARDEKQKSNWDKNRNKAYSGSFLHFMNALVDKKLKEEKFIIMKNSISPTYIDRSFSHAEIVEDSLITFDELQKKWVLKYDFYLQLDYRGEKESREFNLWKLSMTEQEFRTRRKNTLLRNPKKKQTSIIELLKDEIVLEENNFMHNLNSIRRYGYFSFERIGDLLPSNFKIKN